MDNFTNIPNEMIVLSHLQYMQYISGNIIDNSSFHFPGSHLKIKKENIKKYVKIDAKKIEELVNKFKTHKLKAVFSGKIIAIDNTGIFELHHYLFFHCVRVYENNYINKLLDVELSSGDDDDNYYIIRYEKSLK